MVDEKENVLFHHDYDTEITITEENVERKPEIKPRKYCISGYKISKNKFHKFRRAFMSSTPASSRPDKIRRVQTKLHELQTNLLEKEIENSKLMNHTLKNFSELIQKANGILDEVKVFLHKE